MSDTSNAPGDDSITDDREMPLAAENATLRARVAELEREAAEDQLTFDLQRSAYLRAADRWREARGQALATDPWPDLADLCVWTLTEWDKATVRIAALEASCAAKDHALRELVALIENQWRDEGWDASPESGQAPPEEMAAVQAARAALATDAGARLLRVVRAAELIVDANAAGLAGIVAHRELVSAIDEWRKGGADA